jgi:hypothetical protein
MLIPLLGIKETRKQGLSRSTYTTAMSTAAYSQWPTQSTATTDEWTKNVPCTHHRILFSYKKE